MKNGLIALMTLVLMSCGDPTSPSGNSPNPPGSADDSTDSEVYAALTHEKIDTYLAGAAAFPEQQNGDNAFLATLFLRNDKSFILYYAEGNGDVTSTGHALNLRTDSARKIVGQWRVDGAALVAGDSLRCTPLTLNGKDSLRCQLLAAIGQSAAVGKSARLQPGFKGKSPDDSEWASYD